MALSMGDLNKFQIKYQYKTIQ